MIKAKRFYANTSTNFVVYLSSTEFKDQRRLGDGGHPNRCQGAADI